MIPKNSLLRLCRKTIDQSTKCKKQYMRVYACCVTRNCRDYGTRPVEKSDFITHSGLIKSPLTDVIAPSVTIDQYVWDKVDVWPDHIAQECGVTGRKYSFRQLRNLTRRFAASLQKEGFKAGDVLSIMLPNIPEYPIIFFGAVEAGLIVSPMNPIYTPYEIAHQLGDSESICIVTFPEALSKVADAIEIIEKKNGKPLSLFTIAVDMTSDTTPAKTVNFKSLISDSVDTSNIRAHAKPTDIAVLPYSSGTTGLSKGVELTHQNLVWNCQQIMHDEINYMDQTTIDYQDEVPGILPFYHIYGITILMLGGVRSGAKIITLSKFEPNNFLSVLKNNKISVIFAVPPIAIFLGKHETVTKDHLSHLRVLVNGAGPLGLSDGQRLFQKCPNKNVQIKQGFGMTETSAVAIMTPKSINDFASIGVPISNTVIKVIKENNEICKAGEQGEICVKGPQIMKGYRNKPDATANAIDSDQFLHTGDVGYYDKEGKFYIVERIKELIKVKGFQVPPAELEAILRTFPGVVEAAVIGIPDERAGEKPLAFVSQEAGKNIKEEELMKYVETRVAPFKKLAGVVFVDLIPKSPSGKLLRRILREEYYAKIA